MSKFREYYSDPEFKERYLAYKNEQIKCSECGKVISRNNYNIHLKTKFHNNNSTKSLKILNLEKKRLRIEKKYNDKIKEMRYAKEHILDEI